MKIHRSFCRSAAPKIKSQKTTGREQSKTMIEELDRANVSSATFCSLPRTRLSKSYNLNDVTSALLPLLQAEVLRTGHELIIAIDDFPDFAMDDNEIRQLLLTLARNAFEPMEPGGRLTIGTSVENGKVVRWC